MTPLDGLRKDAAARVAVGNGRARVVVQVGHCSQSVGALEVLEALREALVQRPEATLAVAGCDGACFAAPQVVTASGSVGPFGGGRYYSRVTPSDAAEIVAALDDPSPRRPDAALERFFASQHIQIMEGGGERDAVNLDEYVAAGGYGGLAAALERSPEDVIEAVLKSGLQGRGGAYFPPARKWQAARSVDAQQRYVVVNAEEGEPGLFKDRHLMEGVPHRLIEGTLIAAYATGASRCFIYINAEANLSAERVEAALRLAEGAGLAGDDILGSGYACHIEIRRGAGGYVCGEETTLLNTIEGRRREPRLRPPFPTEAGLFRDPTAINNVETLVNLPEIVRRGGARFSHVGDDSARGTKLFCLSGLVQRPGVAELPLGTSLRHVIDGVGGGPPEGCTMGMVVVGGPSSGVLPPSELDVKLLPGSLHPSGVVMGAGGITVLDDTVQAGDAVKRLAVYNARESCGKCTPCREGTWRMVEVLDRLASEDGSSEDVATLEYLAEVVGAASLCGLGQMAGNPVKSGLHFFRRELENVQSRMDSE